MAWPQREWVLELVTKRILGNIRTSKPTKIDSAVKEKKITRKKKRWTS